MIDKLSRWYIKLNKKPLKGESDKKSLEISISVLTHVLHYMLLMMAPVTPFMSETFYQFMKQQSNVLIMNIGGGAIKHSDTERPSSLSYLSTPALSESVRGGGGTVGGCAKATLQYTTLSERFLEMKGAANSKKHYGDIVKSCFGLGRFFAPARLSLNQSLGPKLLGSVENENFYDFDNIFWFNSPWLFYTALELCILMNSLYLSLWLTNFVLIASDKVDASWSWEIIFNTIM
jgi:hypothetical protein